MEPAVLGSINMNIPAIFGPHTSIFMNIKVKTLLFEGIKFCDKPGVIGDIICDIVRNKNLKTIHPGPNGSLKFAFFLHVIIINFKFI